MIVSGQLSTNVLDALAFHLSARNTRRCASFKISVHGEPLAAPSTRPVLSTHSHTALSRGVGSMSLMEKLSSWLGGPARGTPATVLVLGLDHSGKTSLLNALRPSERRSPAEPTLALRLDQFSCSRLSVVALEAKGARRVRALWERHYAAASGVLWVVDAADALRLAVARDEFQLMLAHPAMRARRLPLLVCANKSDLPHALPAAQVAAALGLERVTDKPWHVCATSALSGTGLTDGLAWLTRQLRDLHSHSPHSPPS